MVLAILSECRSGDEARAGWDKSGENSAFGVVGAPVKRHGAGAIGKLAS